MGDVLELPARKLTDVLGAPLDPPLDWFTKAPEWLNRGENGIQVMTSGPEIGRAAGYPYDWNTCWMNSDTGRCDPVKPSPTGCEVFYSGGSTVTCADGTIVNVGVIPYRGGHAPRRMSVAESRNWMDNPAYQGLVGRIVEDEIGGLFLGSVIPELTVEDALLIERSKVSGDWRWRIGMRDPDTGSPIGDGYDFVGCSIVTSTATPRSSAGHGRVEHGYARVAGLDPSHPVIVGPWVDLSLIPEEDLMCPRCGNEHPESTTCAQARLAAPDLPDVDGDGRPDPTGAPGDGGPDVGQTAAPKEPSNKIPASLDLGQLLADQAMLSQRVAEMASQQDEISGRQDVQNERLEQIASALTEIEATLREMQQVELNDDDREKLDDLERTVAQIRDAQSTPATPTEVAASPATAAAG